MEIELEKTYLAKELPAKIIGSLQQEIIDVYYPLESPHPSLRLRRQGNKYSLTKKTPLDTKDFSKQSEKTLVLKESEYKSLACASGKSLRKVRFLYEENGNKYEIDVFQDKLTGLVLIDKEFSEMSDMDKFTPPPFCLVDITQEEFLAGGKLAGKRYQDIQEKLESFGYQPISL